MSVMGLGAGAGMSVRGSTALGGRPGEGATGGDSSGQRAKLRKAAGMMEGLFLRQMFKVMRKTVPDSSLFGKQLSSEIYTEMLDGALADGIAESGGFGLAEQLSRQWGLEGEGETAPIDASGALSALRSLRATQQASAASRQLSAGTLSPRLGVSGAEPAGSGVETHGPAALPHRARKVLGGIAFEAPNRPEPVELADDEQRFGWPLGDRQVSMAPDGTLRPGAEAEVLATRAGKIARADRGVLVIDHGDGLCSLYQGLGRLGAQAGDLVLRGQVIGKSAADSPLRFAAQRDRIPLAPPELRALFK